MQEKDLIAKAEKQKRPIDYLSGPKVGEAIRDVLKRTPQERAAIKHILHEKYF